jgi:hypothetical protein
LAPWKALDTFFSMVVRDRSLGSRARRTFGLAAAVALCSACFSYVPGDIGSVAPEGDVRLELTRVGFAQLPEIPFQPGPDLSGRVVRQERNQLWLRVPVAIRADGMVTGTVHQEVVIPAADIVRLERRVFSRRKTGVVALAGVGALVGTIAAFGSGGPPVGQQPEPPIDEEAGSGAAGLSISLPFSFLFR